MCVCVCVCFNLADVVCAIGLYELSVLSPGGGVVVIWQSGQILLELRAEWRCAGHTVTTRKETEHYYLKKDYVSKFV